MSDTPSYDAMAKQFIELWQKQVAQGLNNPELIHTMLKMSEGFNPANLAKNMSVGETNAQQTQSAATSLSGISADAVSELTKRLDAIEQRLERLESKLESK